MIVYHNNRCTKSREVVNLLKEKAVKFEIRNYMEFRLSKNELLALLKQLDMEVSGILRTTEDAYKLHIKDKNLTDEEIIAIILKNPKLIQRPIVVWDGGALIARPIEKLLEKLNLKN